MLFILFCFIAVIIFLSLFFLKEKSVRTSLREKFQQVKIGDNKNYLIATFKSQPIILKNGKIIFPDFTNTSKDNVEVYRFSAGSFFLPDTADFLIVNGIVKEKRILD